MSRPRERVAPPERQRSGNAVFPGLLVGGAAGFELPAFGPPDHRNLSETSAWTGSARGFRAVCRVCLCPSGGVHSVQWRVQRRPRWQRFFSPVRVGDRGGCSPVGLNPDYSTPGGIPTTTVLPIADDHVRPLPAGPIGHGMRHGVQHASGRVFPV